MSRAGTNWPRRCVLVEAQWGQVGPGAHGPDCTSSSDSFGPGPAKLGLPLYSRLSPPIYYLTDLVPRIPRIGAMTMRMVRAMTARSCPKKHRLMTQPGRPYLILGYVAGICGAF